MIGMTRMHGIGVGQGGFDQYWKTATRFVFDSHCCISWMSHMFPFNRIKITGLSVLKFSLNAMANAFKDPTLYTKVEVHSMSPLTSVASEDILPNQVGALSFEAHSIR